MIVEKVEISEADEARHAEFARTINVVLEDFGVTLASPVRIKPGYKPMKVVDCVEIHHIGTGGGKTVRDRSGHFLVAQETDL